MAAGNALLFLAQNAPLQLAEKRAERDALIKKVHELNGEIAKLEAVIAVSGVEAVPEPAPKPLDSNATGA